MSSRVVLIVGAGKIGSALGRVLSQKGEQVAYWDIDPLKVPHQRPLAELVPLAGVIFFCVPSQAMLDAINQVRTLLDKRTIIVCLEKGIHAGHRETIDVVLSRHLPRRQPFALFGGPMLSDELNKGMRGFGYIGTASRAVVREVTELFADTNVCIAGAADARSIALGGVLKNIYAFLMGVVEGMGHGHNERGYIASRCAEEMSGLLPLLGGKRSHVALEGMFADFIATGFSSYSRNHSAGMHLGKTGELLLEGEGLASLPSIRVMLGKRVARFPLLSAICEVVDSPKRLPYLFDFLC